MFGKSPPDKTDAKRDITGSVVLSTRSEKPPRDPRTPPLDNILLIANATLALVQARSPSDEPEGTAKSTALPEKRQSILKCALRLRQSLDPIWGRSFYRAWGSQDTIIFHLYYIAKYYELVYVQFENGLLLHLNNYVPKLTRVRLVEFPWNTRPRSDDESPTWPSAQSEYLRSSEGTDTEDMFFHIIFQKSLSVETADRIFAPFDESGAWDELGYAARCLQELVWQEYYPDPFPSVASTLLSFCSARNKKGADAPTVPTPDTTNNLDATCNTDDPSSKAGGQVLPTSEDEQAAPSALETATHEIAKDPISPVSADHPDRASLDPNVPQPKLRNESLAIAAWHDAIDEGRTPTKTEIAKKINVSRQTLYNYPVFMRLMKGTQKEANDRKRRLPRGSRDKETGELEAWRGDDDEDD
jgi:hypothetical protein